MSIILVLGDHSVFTVGFPKSADWVVKWFFDGDLGVRFFFVISGFLITHLLLQEKIKTGSISLRSFYIRRALRILPVYYAYLLVVLLLQLSTSWNQPAITWVGNLTFTTNFFPHTWTTGHLWSLAVEEQFYLLWPLLLVLTGLSGNERKSFYILGVALIVAPLCRVITYMKVAPAILYPFFQWSSFLHYFDSLAIGCIAAILLTKHEKQVSSVLEKLKLQSILLGLAFILIPQILRNLLLAGIFTIPLGPAFQAVGFAVLLLQSVLTPELFKPLNWPIIQKLGVLSYSIYIWQMIFCSKPSWFGFSNFWFMSFPGWLLAACLVATASYYGLEKPLMGLRHRFRKTD